jgi:hypothetical protein
MRVNSFKVNSEQYFMMLQATISCINAITLCAETLLSNLSDSHLRLLLSAIGVAYARENTSYTCQSELSNGR